MSSNLLPLVNASRSPDPRQQRWLSKAAQGLIGVMSRANRLWRPVCTDCGAAPEDPGSAAQALDASAPGNSGFLQEGSRPIIAESLELLRRTAP
ncbi:hypothetical protein VTN02DRAFT_442 [Thermoascus thermophilus]